MSKKEIETLEKVNKVDITEEIKAGEAVSAATIPTTADSSKLVVALNFPRAISFVINKETPEEKTLTFYGNAENLRGKPQGILPEGGTYGLTPNVDKADWDNLLKDFGDSPLLRSKLLFASTPDKVRNEVAALSHTRHGYEAIAFKEE